MNSVLAISVGAEIQWNQLSFFENRNADANVRVKVFEFWDVANRHWERETCGIEFVQMGFIMGETIRMLFEMDRVNSG